MPDIFDTIEAPKQDVFDEITPTQTFQPSPEEAGQRSVKAIETISKPDALDDYDKQVMTMYNWLKTASPREREGSALTRFANPLGVRRWLSKKFGTGEEAAWFDALDAYTDQLLWSDPEKWKHFLVGAEQAGVIFRGIGAVTKGVKVLGTVAGQFATYEAIQAPGEGETITQRAEAMGRGALFGYAVGKAGQLIPKARYRIPTTVGGAALVTAVGGGSSKQILDAGAQMFGWEVITLAQGGANKWRVVTEARKFNPELNKIPADEIERGVKQMADIQTALTTPEITPTQAAGAKTPVQPSIITPEHRVAMQAALEASKEVVPIVQAEIGEARGKIAGAMKPKIRSMQEKGLPTEEAIKRSIPTGELAKYTQRFPSVREQLPPEALESYFASIPANQKLRPFSIRNTSDAFTKLIDGSYLTLSEAGYLIKHFQPIAPEIAEMAKARVPMGDKVWQTVKEIINIPYTTLTNVWDMSGLTRQGRFLVQRYPEFAKQYAENYVKSFFSEEATNRIVKEYQSSPNFERAMAVGKLQVTELPSFYEPISEIEETKIAAPFLERIPLMGKYVIRPTARSFTSALNWYRMAIVDRTISAADRNGTPLTDAQLKKLCANVNDFSGRSSIPKALKDIAPFINALFAPRFAISRAKLIGKAYQPDVAIAWASLIGTNLAIMCLIKLLHPDTELELDLRSADGGKLKIDNTRYDLWAGELPYVRSLMRLATGQAKTASGHLIDTDYKREIINIFRSRENPLFSLITDAISGKNYIGEEFGAPPRGRAGEILTELGVPKWVQGMSKEAWNRMGPLTMQDIVDTLVDEGVPMAITAGIASGIGIGVQTYPETAATTLAKYKDEIAQAEFGKNWQDLSALQQKRLMRKYKEDLTVSERKVRTERAETIDYDYVGKLIEEEKKIGRKIIRKLPPEVQSSMSELGVTLGLSRKVGDWVMNDERYEKYQQLTAEEMNKRLSDLVVKPNWQGLSPQLKERRILNIIDRAKTRARNKIEKEANVTSTTMRQGGLDHIQETIKDGEKAGLEF